MLTLCSVGGSHCHTVSDSLIEILIMAISPRLFSINVCKHLLAGPVCVPRPQVAPGGDFRHNLLLQIITLFSLSLFTLPHPISQVPPPTVKPHRCLHFSCLVRPLLRSWLPRMWLMCYLKSRSSRATSSFRIITSLHLSLSLVFHRHLIFFDGWFHLFFY